MSDQVKRDPVERTERFIHALHQLEQRGEAAFAEMLALFGSDQCELSNVSLRPLCGKQGAERFWKDYLAAFKRVCTEFTSVTRAGDQTVLEWISRGMLQSGRAITYEGVTLLRWNGDQVARLRAYHDTAAFIRGGAKHAEEESELPGLRVISTDEVMRGGPRRDLSTPGEGVLTSTQNDRDAATG